MSSSLLFWSFFPAALCSAFQVLGGALHILHNNLCHLEMCVDSWPTFTTAICYRQKHSEGIPDICTVFTKNPETQRSLLLNERVVNWRNRLIFRGSVAELSIRMVHVVSTKNKLHKIFQVFPLPISILNESHVELVDTHLPYGGSQESLNHVRLCIRHLPNHCVTDEKGRPVSWMLSNELCELRMAYILPEYRRAGHLLALSLALIRRMGSVGLPVYCHVNQQNQATINAVTSASLLIPVLRRSQWICCSFLFPVKN
uniref:Glycine N-acyltransferase-like protein n=1 Tax=Sander lucioperca TaxID=283035 RepID=A0A8C9X8A8_SANLU